VLEHRLELADPLAPRDGAWEDAAYTLLFQDTSTATLDETIALVSDNSARAR
jgi:hypothetical protein